MRKYLAITIFIVASLLGQAQSLPIEKQPMIWLRADMPGDSAGFWINVAANEYHAFRTGQNSLPDTVAFNFHNSYLLPTGSTAFSINNYFPASKQNYSIYTVYQIFDTINEYGIWKIQLDSTYNTKLSTLKTKNIRKFIRYTPTTMNVPIINASKQSWRNINIDSTICSFNLCGTDSFGFNGKIAEFIVLNNKVSSIDNEKIHTYLSIKYGIGIHYLNYVNSEDSILWNYKKNKIFKYDIVGLGRDDSLEIYQKQTAAKGGESELTMYLGELKDLNKNNNSTINNNNFILYGHNGDSLLFPPQDTNQSQSYTNLLKRKWKIICAGNSIRQNSFNLRLNTGSIDTVNNFILVINRQESLDFDTTTSIIMFPDSFDNNSNYYCKNIHWDADSSGADVFTFMQMPKGDFFYYNNNKKKSPENSEDPIKQKIEYSLYPNPTAGDFNLDIEATNKRTIYMTIFDIEGKMIMKDEFEGSKTYHIQKTLKTKGNYLITLESGKEKKSIKLIVN
ncbi:MAG: T9SS type A sorting domain-containing protein [Bacteroidetes bacterium]|nr:T9SS type A sorting domain-containing protein [Bacteroidota bacterium]